jgi:hypothetical protein
MLPMLHLPQLASRLPIRMPLRLRRFVGPKQDFDQVISASITGKPALTIEEHHTKGLLALPVILLFTKGSRIQDGYQQ